MNSPKRAGTPKTNKSIEIVCAATGWSRDKAKAEMDRAKANGMTYYRYAHNECWKLNDEEIKALALKLERQSIKRQECLAEVCSATGWSREKAKAEMDRAKANGMTYYRYVHNACWKLNDEEIKALAEKLEKRTRGRQELLAMVCDATGWSREKAKAEMDRAKANGMTYYRYAHNECWKLNDEEIKALAVKLEKRAKRQERLAEVCNATGWSQDRAKAEMAKAKKKGVSNKSYVENSMYDLSDAEIADFARVLKKRKLRWKKDYEFYLTILCDKIGMERPQAEAELQKAKSMGLGYLKYMQAAGWECSEKQLQRIAKLRKAHDQTVSANKKVYIENIRNATGWSRGKVELEVKRSGNECGCSYEDYSAFRFFELSPAQQREYVTLGLFSKMRLKFNDHKVGNELFDNKAAFNRIFSDQIHRKWFTNRGLSYEAFLKHIEGLDAVLAKQLAATQGKGVYKFKVNESEEGNRAAYESIIALDESIVEQYIVQHDAVMQFCPASVNTLRITTLNYQGECKFLYSVFRMGRGSVVDNFHAGGIAASVDVKTGVVYTDAADLNGNVFEIHPYSGLKIKGFQIPHWDKVIETCQQINGRVPEVNLIGWDFAITPDGVDLIEGNPGASYVVAQIPNVKDQIGLRSMMVDPYLGWDY